MNEKKSDRWREAYIEKELGVQLKVTKHDNTTDKSV